MLANSHLPRAVTVTPGRKWGRQVKDEVLTPFIRTNPIMNSQG